MKKGYIKCPFCANEIKEGAIKCQYCEEFLDGTSKGKGIHKKISKDKENIEDLSNYHKSIICWILFPFYNKKKHGYLMKKGYFRFLFSVFVLIILCCLIFIPKNSYYDRWTKSEYDTNIENAKRDVLAYMGGRILYQAGASEDAVRAFSANGMLGVFGVFQNTAERNSYAKEYYLYSNTGTITYNEYLNGDVNWKEVFEKKNRWVGFYDQIREDRIRDSNYPELINYKNEIQNALKKFDSDSKIHVDCINHAEAKYKEAYKMTVTKLKRGYIWENVGKPILITLIVYYGIQAIFLLWRINFVINPKKKDN